MSVRMISHLMIMPMYACHKCTDCTKSLAYIIYMVDEIWEFLCKSIYLETQLYCSLSLHIRKLVDVQLHIVGPRSPEADRLKHTSKLMS